ncbi:Inhibitor of growth protein 4 [Parelaphostrongylus tenuis]|uniref:Inhibitor of growth protein n=1 Tax=Parelaphostrongylus tenuis TaxID=148309 RepID=A0AAD5WIX5_PARTN|nr:Inhibitor of growth protein 4 [Parelaphostrongylus tenuis]
MVEQLKDYLDKLDELPPLMAKSAEEIRELDEKVEKLVYEIQLRLVAHIKNLKKLTKEQKTKWFRETQAMYKEADKLSERKVKLAQKLYDTIDSHIKEMDQQIADFHELQCKKYNADRPESTGSSSEAQKRKSSVSSVRTEKKKKPVDARTSRQTENSSFMDPYKQSAITPVEMPVDPNEPTYCFCHQVSFGQMVACDGPDCKNEWFHFQCVGLTSSPVGKWYCDQCKEARKKKNKM